MVLAKGGTVSESAEEQGMGIAFAYLEPSTYAGDHYYGNAWSQRGEAVKIQQQLSRRQAELLNKCDRSPGALYRPGDWSQRFAGWDAFVSRGITVSRELWPSIRFVFVFSPHKTPRETVWAHDAAEAAALNVVWSDLESIYAEGCDDPWAAGRGGDMDQLYRRWETLDGLMGITYPRGAGVPADGMKALVRDG